MKVKDFLDVLITENAIKVNGELVTRFFNRATDDFTRWENKQIIIIKAHHNCIELEVA